MQDSAQKNMNCKVFLSEPSGPGWETLLLYVTIVAGLLLTSYPSASTSVDLSDVDGKSLFQSLMASRCSVSCATVKIRSVCGTDDVTYSSRCELKRAKKCDGKRVKVKHKGSCPGDPGPVSKCVTERRDAMEIARRQNSEVLIPECNQDGSYNEIQCHTSTGYCWCVTRDGRHIPGTSVKDRKPRCKSKRKKRKGRGGKTKKRKACNSKDRQVFNAALIKVFKEEYDRVNVTPPPTPAPGAPADEFGTEKAIVVWKYNELDVNKDGKLKFKEIRKFGKMVKKLIKPKPCAKRFLDFCDKKVDRTIEKAEWTLCLGVDIKPSPVNSAESPADDVREELMLRPSSSMLQTPDLPVLSSGPSTTNPASKADKQDRKETSQNCPEERESAMTIHSQEPLAKHYIPACTADGQWEKAQCHQSTGYCWCVKEDTGNPIPGTATYKVKPNCTFEGERELKGCPFDQKRRFLVDLLKDLTEERKKLLLENNQTNTGPEDNLSLRETVARWKLKTLDTNNNGVLERNEWRPFRRVTLKNKNYLRKCRRSFLRYCDEDNNKKITYDEWKDCLGLNQIQFNSLPLNPKRKGKNPFKLIDYLKGD